MEGQITFSQLAILIAFLLIVGIGISGILVLRKIHLLLTTTNAALDANLDHMNRIIPNIARISDNALEISSEMRTEAAEVMETLGTLTLNVAESVTMFNEAADRFGDMAAGLVDGVAKPWLDKLAGGGRKSA